MIIETHNECGTLMFQHRVGSKILGTDTDTSDIDMLNVYTQRSQLSCLTPTSISLHNICYEERLDNGGNGDCYAITGIDLVNTFINEFNHSPTHLSKILSHLLVMKLNQDKDAEIDIRQTEAFNFYSDWIKSPGISMCFWDKVANVLFTHLSMIPDKTCNWAQKYDGSDEHDKRKRLWESIQPLQYPIVSSNVGYDTLQASRVIQTLIVAKAVLSDSQCEITQQERDLVLGIKQHQVEFDEYKKLSTQVWKKFRIEYEQNKKFLIGGYLHSIEESKQYSTFGLDGIERLIKLFSESR